MIDFSEDLIKYTKRKDYFKVTNKFTLINESKVDKFIVNVYYLDKYLCKVIARRIDNNSGWEQDLKIKIYSDTDIDKQINNSEILSIGSSFKNYKIIDFYTDIELEKELIESTESIFPKKIIFLLENNKFNNFEQYLNVLELFDNNSNFNFYFFNEIDQRKFIKNNCFKYLEIYDISNDKDLKSMIFICNYLYLNGGVFISDSIIFKNRINEIIMEQNMLYLNFDSIIKFLLVPKNEDVLINYINNLINNNNIHDIFLNIDTKFKKIDESYYVINGGELNVKNIKQSSNNSQLYFNLNNYKFWIYIDIIENKISNFIDAKFNIEHLNFNYFLLKIEFSENKNILSSNNDKINIKYLNESNDELNVISIKYNDLNKNTFIFKI